MAGMDWPSINFSGINIRYSWLFVVFFVILRFINISLSYRSVLFIGFFILSMLPSTMLSINIHKSFFYIWWVLFNYIFFYSASIFYIKNHRHDFFNALIWFSRVNILIAIIFYLVDFQIRPSAFFYEPSYLSIALIPYCCLVFVNQNLCKCNRVDYIFIFIFLLISQSGVFLITILLAIFFGINFKNIKYIILMFVSIILYLLYSDDYNSIYFFDVIGNITSIDVYQFFSRAGNRFPRLLSTYDVALNHFYFGVGLGSYDSYTHLVNVDLYDFSNEYLSGYGQPGVNIWLELFATGGVFPFLILTFFTFYLPFEIIKSQYNVRFKLILYVIIFLIMMIESNFLRAYLWCYIPIFLIKK